MTATQIEVVKELTDDEKLIVSDPYVSLFRDCVENAIKMKASDIHVEPRKDSVVIRFRVFGDLIVWRILSQEHKHGFIFEIKRLTNLSIAVSGRPQDGRISYQKYNLDLRVNLLPSLHGEKIVLRLLDLSRSFGLKSIGFSQDVLSSLEALTKEANGVCIVSGPTGSGKTTTLYSLLTSVDRITRNVVTLENPVEYTIEGITQVDINEKVTFGQALRSVLRQDPDVILVGEIRDEETAKLCFQAAATGHLVFTTLHANGAAEIIGRLRNLGIDTDTIQENLRFAGAQRLVRHLCQDCSLWIRNEGRARNSQGCESCSNGIVGRLPIMEFMERNEVKDHFEMSGNSIVVEKSLKAEIEKLVRCGLVDLEEARFYA